MDGHPRQNPAYRPATESPRMAGVFHFRGRSRRAARLRPVAVQLVYERLRRAQPVGGPGAPTPLRRRADSRRRELSRLPRDDAERSRRHRARELVYAPFGWREGWEYVV